MKIGNYTKVPYRRSLSLQPRTFKLFSSKEPVLITKHKRTTGNERVFSILIPTWNNLAYLQNCISAIRKNSSYRHQLIIHVNEGKDGTLDWIEQQPDIDYTYSRENVGICFALNAGRELVSTSYMVYLNDDMYVCPRWDEYLFDEIKKVGHPYFFLSSTAIEPAPGNPCTIFHDYGRDIASFREDDLLREYAALEKGDWQGSTWPPNVVHTSIWDLVGGYSIEFSPGFYSDPDFSMKLWQAGVRLFKGVSKSRAYHFVSKSTHRLPRRKQYYTFLAKWGITSSTLTSHYLRRGQPFDEELSEAAIPAAVRLKNLLKRWISK